MNGLIQENINIIIMNKIKILSYNIWFEIDNIIERTNSLIKLINTKSFDVICLQEVKQDIYKIIKNNINGYKYFFPNEIKYSYGCVIISKYKISKSFITPFKKSKMGRNLVITIIDYPYTEIIDNEIKKIVIVTSHFESIFNKTNFEKICQFSETQIAIDNLYKEYKNVILCADTNIMEHEEKYFISKEWRDSWKEMGSPKNEEYTYDYYTNENLQKRLIGKYQSRIDRILFRCDNMEIYKFGLIKGLENMITPSDHHGIYSKFILK